MADARATFRCQRQRSACLRGMSRYNATREGAQGTFGFNGALMDATSEMRWEHVDARQRPLLIRPRRLICFAAIEQIELGEPFVDGRTNAQVEYGTADAVRLKLRVVAVLVEVKAPLERHAVHHTGEVIIQVKHEEAQHAGLL